MQVAVVAELLLLLEEQVVWGAGVLGMLHLSRHLLEQEETVLQTQEAVVQAVMLQMLLLVRVARV
jgi:hypothetical protein